MRKSIAGRRRQRTIGPAVQHTYIPPPQSATQALDLAARKLLLIFRPVEGRRLSWPDL